jgi:CRP-like cAMP-binding protein
LTCAACGVRGQTVCAPLGIAELDIVESFRVGSRKLGAHTDIFSQGEVGSEVYTILGGWVMLYTLLEDGRRQIVDFCLPGAFIGFQPDLDAPSKHTAEALTPVELYPLPKRGLLSMFAQHPEMAVRMACIVARDQVFAYQHLASVGRRTARGRIANLLLELFVRVRQSSLEASGDSIHLPLTQEHLADALGLTSVHVNRTLRVMREDGVLAGNLGAFSILNPDRLAEETGFDADVSIPRGPAG